MSQREFLGISLVGLRFSDPVLFVKALEQLVDLMTRRCSRDMLARVVLKMHHDTGSPEHRKHNLFNHPQISSHVSHKHGVRRLLYQKLNKCRIVHQLLGSWFVVSFRMRIAYLLTESRI